MKPNRVPPELLDVLLSIVLTMACVAGAHLLASLQSAA